MWLRWTITKLKNTTGICQMAELYLYDSSGNKISWASGTTVHAPSRASYPSNEGPEMIIDGNVDTKFCLLNFSVFNSDGMDIIFELPEGLDVGHYNYVTADDSEERDPVSWTLSTSADGTEWTLLSVVENATITSDRKTETQIFDITEITGHRYIIQANNTLYTVENSELKVLEETKISAKVFQLYGSYEPPTLDILSTFENPKVYCWSNDVSSTKQLQANMKATPLPQTVITNDIDISHVSITGIEKVTAEYTGDPHVACSFDGGTTWKLYNGVAWVVLSESETGMTMETLLAITTESWTEVIEGLDSFKMRFTLSTTDDTVTNIVINFTN